ncbi:hypothetical protein [Adhaeribacter swui]|uniref:hypothetical protein n=1 Tax=Adhaeribacter swui TaxID=2086471 RepID=UPI00293BC3A3|nr:hypothetical protein [Adhaeribacter swui]
MLVFACQPDSSKKATSRVPDPVTAPLFTLLPPEKTGVTFANTLTEGLNTNVLMYEYFYNGGGVAVGILTTMVCRICILPVTWAPTGST